MLQAKDVRRGQLDRQITFIKRVVSRGNANQDKVTWTEVDSYPEVFARIKEMPGVEMIVHDQLKFFQKTEFIVMYRTDITAKNRLVYGSKVYEIISVTETEQRGMYTKVIGNYLDNEPNPLIGAFSSAFSSAFDV